MHLIEDKRLWKISSSKKCRGCHIYFFLVVLWIFDFNNKNFNENTDPRLFDTEENEIYEILLQLSKCRQTYWIFLSQIFFFNFTSLLLAVFKTCFYTWKIVNLYTRFLKNLNFFRLQLYYSNLQWNRYNTWNESSKHQVSRSTMKITYCKMK